MLEIYCAACWLAVGLDIYEHKPEDLIKWIMGIFVLIFAPVVLPAIWIKDKVL